MSPLLSQEDQNLTPPLKAKALFDPGPAAENPAHQTDATLNRSGLLFPLSKRTATASGFTTSVLTEPQEINRTPKRSIVMSSKDLLDQVQVKTPCEADWTSMRGNDRVRFCEHCNLSVHDLSQMTRKRARRLVAKSKGRLCIRYLRRPDGSMVTRAVPQKLFQIGRRASRIAAGAFSATLSLSGAVAGASSERSSLGHTQPLSSAAFAQQNSSRQSYSGSTIAGTVTDPNGALIQGATVSLSNDQSHLSLVTSSNSEGEYRFEALESGLYKLRIEALGFAAAEIGEVYLAASANQRADQRLEVAGLVADVEITGSARHSFQGGAMVIIEPSEPLVKAAHADELIGVLEVLTRENVNVRDKGTRMTALEYAVFNGNREMLQALLSAGADVNSRNESKQTVLMLLGEETTSDMVWDLIHAGAKIDATDDDGDTALIAAAEVNNLGILQTLLQAGAKVNAKNDGGQTALMMAADDGLIKNVKALVAAGADLNAHDNEGKTALDYAEDGDYEKIVKLLLSYGAIRGTSKEEPRGENR